MSATAMREQVYPLHLGHLVAKAARSGIAMLLSTGFTVYLLVGTSWTGVAVFFILVTLALLALFLDPLLKMPASLRYALAVSDAGIRVPDALPPLDQRGRRQATGLVPWGEIERILVVCVHVGGGQSDLTARIIGGNTPHIRIMREGGEPFVYTGPSARAYHVADASELRGGERAFTQLALDLHAWSKRKGVRLALVADERSRWKSILNDLPCADFSELEHQPLDHE